MHFYEVLVSSDSYHGNTPLTYSSPERLPVGSIVLVNLRRKVTKGIVARRTVEPTFKTRPILDVFPKQLRVPNKSLELLDWLSQYYPAPLGLITSLFLPAALTLKTAHDNGFKAGATQISSNLPPLTKQQRSIFAQIRKKGPGSFLVHGETGTGKTRLYAEAAKQCLEKGRSVLVLTPEIGLTPQLLDYFAQNFGEQVLVTHSSLPAARRRDIWIEVLRAKTPKIVIGPRSALFLPFNDLGLIVVDEFHDTAYKQEQAPRYQATRVASQLARLHGATLIFGSATPTISDYYLADQKSVPILRMTEPALGGSSDTKVHVINLRDKANFGSSAHLSNALLTALGQALKRKEQGLVFLNRRGSARLVLCRSCGWRAVCPRCDLPLTYHADSHSLRCHTCGYQTTAVTACPTCGAVDILYRYVGTKSILEELQKVFPKAVIKRFDTDNLALESLPHSYEQIKTGQIDILVGTQILTKGFDLPKLSVAGVVNADSSLLFPDYSAEERTFQILYQLLGRVGRGHRPGIAIVQTWYPDSLAIQNAIKKDWPTFYEQQLKLRQQFRFPPFAHLMKLVYQHRSAEQAETASRVLFDKLASLNKPVQLIGPTPCFYEKVGHKYRWQIVVKAKRRSSLSELVTAVPAPWVYDLDPASLL